MTAPAWIEAAAVVVLACITGWYAVSTHRMLAEMRKQRRAGDKQLQIMVKATLATCYAALWTHGRPIPGNVRPDGKLAQLAEQLEEVDNFLNGYLTANPRQPSQ